jgi:hypothetical protein
LYLGLPQRVTAAEVRHVDRAALAGLAGGGPNTVSGTVDRALAPQLAGSRTSPVIPHASLGTAARAQSGSGRRPVVRY